jgi:hypothetical protein
MFPKELAISSSVTIQSQKLHNYLKISTIVQLLRKKWEFLGNNSFFYPLKSQQKNTKKLKKLPQSPQK